MNRSIPRKQTIYKTARARIGCAQFSAGEFVSVQYTHTKDGIDWYLIERSERGQLPHGVAYPDHHLTDFCL